MAEDEDADKVASEPTVRVGFSRNPDGGYRRHVLSREALDAKFAGDEPVIASLTGELQRSHFFACQILAFFFGSAWLAKRVAADTGTNFLEDWRGSAARTVTARRTVELAELLLNLQHVKGIEAVFDQLASDQLTHDQVESAFAELQAGALLDHARTPFRYIWPAKITREDFDIELGFKCGLRGCAEVKSKLTSTTPSKATALDALKKARVQLPKTEFPLVVFLKLPHNWTTPENTLFVEEAIEEFLRNTRQVVSVIGFFAIEQFEGATITTTITSLEVWNARHNFDPSLDFRVLSDNMKPRDNWFTIQNYVRSKLGTNP